MVGASELGWGVWYVAQVTLRRRSGSFGKEEKKNVMVEEEEEKSRQEKVGCVVMLRDVSYRSDPDLFQIYEGNTFLIESFFY